MKKKLFRYIILFTLLSLTILCILFNAKIIHFLQQFKTTNTLLNYPKLWDEKIHDWLGDIITLVGVMLAFSLPFTAQVTQWTVNTYGVKTFPDIANEKLNVSNLLRKMFIFIGILIFWRVFIFKISPYTLSLYILFNTTIAVFFIYILYNLFHLIKFILKCTFNFEKFIITPAYQHIEKTINSIPTPYYKITDPNKVPNVDKYYFQSLEILRDYEIFEFKRGNIPNKFEKSFNDDIWRYILALFSTNDIEKAIQAVKLQDNLSSSIKTICITLGKKSYARYLALASSLAYHLNIHRYYFHNDNLKEILENDQKKHNRQSPINRINYYADLIFLAEEIECINLHTDKYCPILSCRFLLNFSGFGYIYALPQSPPASFNWKHFFTKVNDWENDILWLSEQLITISEKYQVTSALMNVYDNLRNDTQYTHQREIYLYEYIANNLDYSQGMKAAKLTEQISKISSMEEINQYVNFFLSEEFNTYFVISNEQKSELFQKLLRIRYKLKVDHLILFWFGRISFDTSIIIRLLEKAYPIDAPKIQDIGEHLLPSSFAEIFHQYLNAEKAFSDNILSLNQSEKYQIIFSTMTLYFLIKEIKLEKQLNIEEMANSLVTALYHNSSFSIQDIKSIREIAKLWRTSPKGIEQNQVIRNLCVNYGINFDTLKKLYTDFLITLEQSAEQAINTKILVAPLDQELIEALFDEVRNKISPLFKEISNNIEIRQLNTPLKQYRFLSIDREWFIKANTGVYYVRDNLSHPFYYICRNYLRKNKANKLIVFQEPNHPTITNFYYREVGQKIYFYCEYNFCFE